ncbi:carboxypeptidase-like regulatory domain-containing protein [Loigolactobacillus bifermentans]|uniref:Bacterial Ig domain-containing protein n=1 Tax=Loigolactobacillus bifermentans DSM 20003 TaxID=1423726 RepID=A0A0R1GKU8_9LACO|nr:carboxypeptidase-like regulatory domain-containing protein [Loigolactobacillus bifermentans]KRK34521.1 hypothetical protein FC07_GL000534 [Loigolactobacillus bifermentans DSM 20003]QGG61296.1 carboxypeptidase regulatory-like domain-containing protein [Loigolactobacillus bifermentans]
MKKWVQFSLLLLLVSGLAGCSQKLSITDTRSYVTSSHTANGGYGMTRVTGKAAPNAQVYATSANSDVVNHTKANHNGTFQLKALVAGQKYQFYTRKRQHDSKKVSYTMPKTPTKLQTKIDVQAPVKNDQLQIQAHNGQAEIQGKTSQAATVVLYSDAGASNSATTADFITSAPANKKGQFDLKVNVHHNQTTHLKLYAYTAKQLASRYVYVTVGQ